MRPRHRIGLFSALAAIFAGRQTRLIQRPSTPGRYIATDFTMSGHGGNGQSKARVRRKVSPANPASHHFDRWCKRERSRRRRGVA